MSNNITDKEYKNQSIERVKKQLKEGSIINHCSEPKEWECEWCDKTSRVVFIQVEHKTFPNFTSYPVFEDPKFRRQLEWFVCGTCEDN